MQTEKLLKHQFGLISHYLDYIDSETHEKMIKLYDEIGRMLCSMAENPEKFIPRKIE